MTNREAFLAAVRGIPNHHLTQALNQLTPGIDWRGSSRARMAESYDNSNNDDPLVRSRGHNRMKSLDLETLAMLARARADGYALWFDPTSVRAFRAAQSEEAKKARVAAAADEMLNALYAVTLHFSGLPLMEADRDVLAKAFAAIAKAEGKS
jgi:hypothetical protein